MAANDRVYMVAAFDENDDGHLFTTDDLGRAEIMRELMLSRYGNALPNWKRVDDKPDAARSY